MVTTKDSPIDICVESPLLKYFSDHQTNVHIKTSASSANFSLVPDLDLVVEVSK